jgi:hypothetical protein
MLQNFKRAGIVAALAVGAMAVSTSAGARDRYYRHHGGDTAGAAIAGGIIGLALGAAIASSNDRDRYYDGYYGRPRGYYYRSYPRYRYYRAYPRNYYYYDSYPRYYRHGGRGWQRGWGW